MLITVRVVFMSCANAVCKQAVLYIFPVHNTDFCRICRGKDVKSVFDLKFKVKKSTAQNTEFNDNSRRNLKFGRLTINVSIFNLMWVYFVVF